jgi:hypothetical protein
MNLTNVCLVLYILLGAGIKNIRNDISDTTCSIRTDERSGDNSGIVATSARLRLGHSRRIIIWFLDNFAAWYVQEVRYVSHTKKDDALTKNILEKLNVKMGRRNKKITSPKIRAKPP